MMKQERIILPIEKKPIQHGYTYLANFWSMIQPRMRLGLSDSRIKELQWIIHDEVRKEYKIDSACPSKEELVCIDGEFMNVNVNSRFTCDQEEIFLYNIAEGNSACQFYLDAFKQVSNDSSAGLKIISPTDDKQMYVGFGINNTIRISGRDKESKFEEVRERKAGDKWIKVCRFDGEINFYTSSNGSDWTLEYQKKDFFEHEEVWLGYYLMIGHDSFEDWANSNFIQIHCSSTLNAIYDVKLTYYMGVRVRCRYHLKNPWIVQYYYSTDFINEHFDILDFIRWNVEHEQYLSLFLDEKYVPDTAVYNRIDFDHESLVYGYDSKEEKVYLLGYDKAQEFFDYTLSFTELKQSYKNLEQNHELVSCKANMPAFHYYSDKLEIIKFFKEYLDGTDSSYRDYLADNDRGESGRVYGIKCYDVLYQYARRLRDKRVTYMLYEHKKCMWLRLSYFLKKSWITSEQYTKLSTMLKELEEGTYSLMLQAIKLSMSKTKIVTERLQNNIERVKNLDINFVTEIIQCLSKSVAD